MVFRKLLSIISYFSRAKREEYGDMVNKPEDIRHSYIIAMVLTTMFFVFEVCTEFTCIPLVVAAREYFGFVYWQF